MQKYKIHRRVDASEFVSIGRCRYEGLTFLLDHAKRGNMKNATLKEFSKYVVSNVLGMIGMSCYILADTFFISKGMGSDGLTALNLACPAFNFMFGFGLMLGVGGATRFSLLKGSGDLDAANKSFTHSLILTEVFSLIFLIIGLTASGPIATALGANEATYGMCKEYISVILCFAPFFLNNYLFQSFVRNDGAPRLTMIAMIAGNLFNILFDWVLVFPCGLGIFGAALATALSPVLSLIILSTFFMRKKNSFRVSFGKPSVKTVGKIAGAGLPSFLAEFSTAIILIIFNKLFLKLSGNIGVAAYTVIVNVFYVVIAMYNGVASGIQPLVSKSFGEGDYKKTYSYFRYALFTLLAMSAIIYIAIFFGTDGIVGIFNEDNDQTMQSLATLGLRLYFISALFSSFNLLISSFLAASDKPIPAHAISLLRGYVIIIPSAFLLSHLGGTTGLWLATPIAEAITLIVAITLFVVIYEKRKKEPMLA